MKGQKEEEEGLRDLFVCYYRMFWDDLYPFTGLIFCDLFIFHENCEHWTP